jgi:hypothetical protein
MRLKRGTKRVYLQPNTHRLPDIHGIHDPLEAAVVASRRKKLSKDLVSNFYIRLYQAIYGGKVLRTGENHHNTSPLFEKQDLARADFRPDLVKRVGTKEIHVEVKASQRTQARPWFGYHQFSSYCRSFLENHEADMHAALFMYGKRRPEKLHVCTKDKVKTSGCAGECDNRHLIERLSHSTRELLILPHNLLTFLLMASPTEERNQESSNSYRDVEHYYRPFRKWLGLFGKHWQDPQPAIDEVMEDVKKQTDRLRGDPLRGFKPEDFFLDCLESSSSRSPTNLWCLTFGEGFSAYNPSYKISGFNEPSFPIVEYSLPEGGLDRWKTKFAENLDGFLMALGVDLVWEKQQKRIVENHEAEQKRIKEQEVLDSKPKDGIPF